MGKLQFVALGALSLVALAPAASAQNALADSGFDSQGSSVSSYCYAGSCPSGSWVLYSGGGFVRQGDINWPAPSPPSSPMMAFIQGASSSVSQTFVAPSSGPYVVAFWLASRHDFVSVDGNQTITVALAGQIVAQKMMSSDMPFARYVSSAVNLTAGATYMVSFAGGASGDHTAFVDSVAVVPAGATTSYRYDAQGRLIGVSDSGGVNDGVNRSYSYDPASNRTSVQVTGAH